MPLTPLTGRAGRPADCVNLDPSLALADDAWAVLLTRVGIAIILISQPLYVVSELRFGGVNPWLLTEFHVVNFAAALIGLSLSWTRAFRDHWRAAALALCAMIIVSSTVMSISVGGRNEALFVSLLLIMLGSALLLPWEARWQFGLGILSVLALGANSVMVGHVGPSVFYHWLGVITAACLAQSATAFGVRYRERTKQYQALREREIQLSESEEKFRRIFETSSDVIVITRIDDGRILDVNRAFVDTTGYEHQNVIGRRPVDLDLWEDKEQVKVISDAMRTTGFVRNAEGRFRLRGEPVSALISSVKAIINGEECAISSLRDVTELHKIHEELVAAREAALAASEAKSQFLSCMSHEIRTPLNVILGSADLLTDTTLSLEQRHYIERISNSGATLLDLLNSILDLTRVESGQLSLEQVPMDVAELTERVADTLAIRAHEKRIDLVVRVAPDLPTTLMGDPLRLNQILTNLIGNSLKFTDHGEIVVTAELDPDNSQPGMLRFSVRDTGIGIPADKLTGIFSPFAQADSSTTRRFGGSGLGLTIVERLVRLMGGRVWIESEVGKGSCFNFTVRLAVPQTQAENPARVNLSGFRVMVMDPGATSRVVAVEIFAAAGALVTEAVSAAEAMEAIENSRRAGKPFDAILADCSRADADGFELARLIDAMGHEPSAEPIIAAINSHDLSAQFVRLQAAHIGQYVVKPLKRADLLTTAANLSTQTAAATTSECQLPATSAQTVDPAPAVPEVASAPADQAVVSQSAKESFRILLADDSVDNRMLIRAYLSKAGYGLDEAENGQVAVDKLLNGHYDLVLMDIQMPVMDGFSAVRRIRKWEHDTGVRHTPIIALTASAFDETVRKAEEVGCDSHLGKPVKRTTLLRVIHETANGESASAADGNSASAAA